jgi:hypothetical protein
MRDNGGCRTSAASLAVSSRELLEVIALLVRSSTGCWGGIDGDNASNWVYAIGGSRTEPRHVIGGRRRDGEVIMGRRSSGHGGIGGDVGE